MMPRWRRPGSVDAIRDAGLKSNGAAMTPPTIGELAETLVMDQSTIGQNLRPLEREGLVELVRTRRTVAAGGRADQRAGA